MNKKIYIILVAIVALVFYSSDVLAQKKAKSRYVPRENSKGFAAAGYTGALEYYKLIRNNIETGEFHPEDYYAARQEVELFDANKDGALTWKSIGPTDQGGRVRALLFDKDNPEVMYAGAVSGGLWKTTNGGQSWQPINDLMPSLIVSCVAQGPDGIIYFGTGEGFAPVFGSTAGSTGFVGMGLFKSTDATGTSFTQIETTAPTSSNGWDYIYKVKVAPNGDIYAATGKGIKKSSDQGATWTNPLVSFTGSTAEAYDVDISPNGNIISLVVANRVYISKDGGSTYTNVSTGGTMLPTGSLSRIEVDIAPSNPDYIYACAAKSSNEKLHNIYRSTDAGQTWTIIGPGGSDNFNPLGTQGYYDNVIKVHPTNPNKVYVGGLDMWTWEEGGTWEQKSMWNLSEFSSFFLHADHHEYVFHPNNPNIMYFGTDGGISVSTNGGNTFTTVNRNFTTLQSYAISVSKEGMIMTGTQDNGTLWMDRKGFVEGRSVPVLGGDGGYSAFSFLNEKLLFGTVYYGDVNRTPTADAEGMSQFYDSWVEGLSNFNSTTFASFVTPLLLHEKIDDYLSPDSVTYTHTGDSVFSGQTIQVPSKTSGYLFNYTLPSTVPFMVEDDKITVQDIVTSKFYVGINGWVIMTREAHNFASVPQWWPIAKITGTAQSMSVSKCGNYLFVGTQGGRLYRISNLNYANDSISACVINTTVTSYPSNPFCVIETKELTVPGINSRPINNIAIDPNNPERIVVVAGNYSSTANFVFYSGNALDATPTFSSKQGALPKVPVYSALIEMTNPNKVLIGTEFGIYMTTNITATTPVWTEENDGGIARVPVYDLKQQVYMFPGVTNFGMIYAGTHGRGVFESSNFVAIPEIEPAQPIQSLLHVYPNPATDQITVQIPGDNNFKNLRVFTISGKTIQQISLNKFTERTYTLNISSLTEGVYFVELSGDQARKTGKFIKLK